MTPEQRERAVELLGDGATIREAAALVKATERGFSAYWINGQTDSENGVESEAGSWYRRAQAARASIRAAIRAEAAEEAGSRRSSDLLAVLARLEGEVEPTAVADAGGVRASSPILWLTDRIEDPTTTPEERARLRGILQRGCAGMNEMFVEMTRPEAIASA